jgi:hypothetical protein
MDDNRSNRFPRLGNCPAFFVFRSRGWDLAQKHGIKNRCQNTAFLRLSFLFQLGEPVINKFRTARNTFYSFLLLNLIKKNTPPNNSDFIF